MFVEKQNFHFTLLYTAYTGLLPWGNALVKRADDTESKNFRRCICLELGLGSIVNIHKNILLYVNCAQKIS